jgi:hypothetical protein
MKFLQLEVKQQSINQSIFMMSFEQGWAVKKNGGFNRF